MGFVHIVARHDTPTGMAWLWVCFDLSFGFGCFVLGGLGSLVVVGSHLWSWLALSVFGYLFLSGDGSLLRLLGPCGSLGLIVCLVSNVALVLYFCRVLAHARLIEFCCIVLVGNVG